MPYIGAKPILNAARSVRRKYPLQQFGQPYDSKWNDGATGCGAACWQYLIRFWTGRHYTLDQVAILAQHPANSGGLEYHEVKNLIAKTGLPYKSISTTNFTTVIRASNLGPVFIPTMYSHWPEWKGYHVYGLTADGKPNGFAIQKGKTQLRGFAGRHATVLLGYLPYDSNGDGVADYYRAFVMEPNHGSPARPEKPPYDVITSSQYKVAYDRYLSATGSIYAFVLTRQWTQP